MPMDPRFLGQAIPLNQLQEDPAGYPQVAGPPPSPEPMLQQSPQPQFMPMGAPAYGQPPPGYGQSAQPYQPQPYKSDQTPQDRPGINEVYRGMLDNMAAQLRQTDQGPFMKGFDKAQVLYNSIFSPLLGSLSNGLAAGAFNDSATAIQNQVLSRQTARTQARKSIYEGMAAVAKLIDSNDPTGNRFLIAQQNNMTRQAIENKKLAFREKKQAFDEESKRQEIRMEQMKDQFNRYRDQVNLDQDAEKLGIDSATLKANVQNQLARLAEDTAARTDVNNRFNYAKRLEQEGRVQQHDDFMANLGIRYAEYQERHMALEQDLAKFNATLQANQQIFQNSKQGPVPRRPSLTDPSVPAAAPQVVAPQRNLIPMPAGKTSLSRTTQPVQTTQAKSIVPSPPVVDQYIQAFSQMKDPAIAAMLEGTGGRLPADPTARRSAIDRMTSLIYQTNPSLRGNAYGLGQAMQALARANSTGTR